MSQAKCVGPDVLHRVQGAAVLGRNWAGQAALKIGGRPQHGGLIGDADGDIMKRPRSLTSCLRRIGVARRP